MENNFETLGFAFMCDSENGALSANARASIIHCVIKHNAFFGLNERNWKWNSWVLRTSSCPPSSSVGGGNLQVTDFTFGDWLYLQWPTTTQLFGEPFRSQDGTGGRQLCCGLTATTLKQTDKRNCVNIFESLITAHILLFCLYSFLF